MGSNIFCRGRGRKTGGLVGGEKKKKRPHKGSRRSAEAAIRRERKSNVQKRGWASSFSDKEIVQSQIERNPTKNGGGEANECEEGKKEYVIARAADVSGKQSAFSKGV